MFIAGGSGCPTWNVEPIHALTNLRMELDAGKLELGFGAEDCRLEVHGDTSVAAKPGGRYVRSSAIAARPRNRT